MAAIRFAIYCCIFSFSISLSYAADECAQNIPGHYEDRYIDHKDGTLTDRMTGLMWSKCIMGMTWDAGRRTCVGSKSGEVENRIKPLIWQDTLKAAENTVYAGYSDWRLPNIKELASLMDVACMSNTHSMALDIRVFNIYSISNDHASAVSNYWSSTPFREVIIDDLGAAHNQAWHMSFATGTGLDAKPYSIHAASHIDDKTGVANSQEQNFYARLVRGNSQ